MVFPSFRILAKNKDIRSMGNKTWEWTLDLY